MRGIAASSGIVTGKARLVIRDEDLRKIDTGEIIVTRFTTPFFMPYLLDVSAVVTDIGGITSHAASVAREIGIPAVVGTRVATSTLENGQRVTVDGDKGVVYYE